MGGFGPEILHGAKAAGKEPFPGGAVGCLRVHVDKAVALADGDEVIFGFAAGVIGPLAPDFCAHGQKLPAPAGIFDVDDFRLSINLHMGDEPVGPGQKSTGGHVGVMHGCLLKEDGCWVGRLALKPPMGE